jgi:hypothetical protein
VRTTAGRAPSADPGRRSRPVGSVVSATYDEAVPGARERRVSRAAVLAVVVLGTSACSVATGAPVQTLSPDPVTSVAAAVPVDAATASEAAAALDVLLDRRQAAVLAGDTESFAATVAEPTSPAGGRQLAAYRSARDLHLSRLVHDEVPPVEDPAGGVVVRLRYRVGGVDRADRAAHVRYRLARVGDRWRVTAEEPTPGEGAAPWLAMPGMQVERGERAVVAGTSESTALAETVATVDAVLPELADVWDGAPARVLVLLPRTEEQAAVLLGRVGEPVGDVAATTEGPVDGAGLATGDRVVIDPSARARLRTVGREVVLAHELAHVAVRATVPGSAPAWLSEGYADHIGYGRTDLPTAELAAPLVQAVLDGRGPAELPSADDLDPATHDISVGYLAAWQAVETVIARRGEATLRALVRACSVTDGEAAAERTCDAAMPAVLGEDRDQLTAAWVQRMAALAG